MKSPTPTEQVQEILVSSIKPSKTNPRKHFDPAYTEELAASFLAQGLQQPIVIRPKDNGYEMVMGECRWRGHKLAKLKTIKAIVRDLDDARAELAQAKGRKDHVAARRQDFLDCCKGANLKDVLRAGCHLVESYGSDDEQLAHIGLKGHPSENAMVDAIDGANPRDLAMFLIDSLAADKFEGYAAQWGGGSMRPGVTAAFKSIDFKWNDKPPKAKKVKPAKKGGGK